MLDLIFLIFLLITLFFALRGDYRETICNIATVMGILAAIIGFVVMFLQSSSRDSAPVFLRIFELVFAFTLRYIAKHFVKLYKNKEAEEQRKINESMTRYTREDPNAMPPVYNDDNFDDPDIRFGKGGFTDNSL